MRDGFVWGSPDVHTDPPSEASAHEGKGKDIRHTFGTGGRYTEKHYENE